MGRLTARRAAWLSRRLRCLRIILPWHRGSSPQDESQAGDERLLCGERGSRDEEGGVRGCRGREGREAEKSLFICLCLCAIVCCMGWGCKDCICMFAVSVSIVMDFALSCRVACPGGWGFDACFILWRWKMSLHWCLLGHAFASQKRFGEYYIFMLITIIEYFKLLFLEISMCVMLCNLFIVLIP